MTTTYTNTKAAHDRLATNGATMTTDDVFIHVAGESGRIEFQVGLPRLNRAEATRMAHAVCDTLEAIKAARETA